MKEVAYLLGAGASRNALPIVIDMPARLQACRNLISEFKFQIDLSKKQDAKNKQSAESNIKKIVELFDMVISESQKHASIDTFAKKLYIKKEFSKLKDLKFVLLVFFKIEQLGKPDPRYDLFWASIINSDSDQHLPDGIKIISWNYDYQLEKSFSEFIFEPNYDNVLDMLNVIPLRNDYTYVKKFSIFKLNGTAIPFSSFKNNYSHVRELFRSQMDESFILHISQLYINIFTAEGIAMDMCFAWERKSTLIPILRGSFQQVQSLIIIGYSFPFFNREIDSELLNSMVSLKRIYIQSPEADNIIERINSIIPEFSDRKIIIHKIFDINQFHLPWELS